MSDGAGGPKAEEESADRDWLDWQRVYDDPNSAYLWRLHEIQDQICRYLDDRPSGAIRVISMCAGQGRDLIGALAGHARRFDVTARLVELDPRNVANAIRLASENNLSGIEVVAGDASDSTAYAGAAPADLILACGMLGNLRLPDVRNTITHLLSLLSPGGSVIWTYHRLPPDNTTTVRNWFSQAGYEEMAFDAAPNGPQVVGVHRLLRPPTLFRQGIKMFTFVGYDNLGYENLPATSSPPED